MDKKIKDIGFWLCLGKNIKIGSVGIQQILETKVDIESIFNLPETNLRKLGLSPRLIEQILICRQYDPNEIVAELKNHGVSIITLNSPGYPRLLKEIHTPPTLLYYKGRLDSSAFTIGIVGSRKPTDYGRQVTYDLAYKLASSGTCIVSGLALGIDSIAHEAALDAGGQTIAVLGCGLDTIYPKKHEQLAKRILASGGSIISEYPIGTHPARQNFPARNRIISGLSQGLVVTEAGQGSGSLITAKDALEQNREVFAVPGSIYNRNSSGPSGLIKLGAHLVESVDDIYDELGLKKPEIVKTTRKLFPGSPTEEIIFDLLKDEPRHIDLIIKESGLSHDKISSALTIMEINGKVRHLGGLTYRLNN